jgi:hypothetical protein
MPDRHLACGVQPDQPFSDALHRLAHAASSARPIAAAHLRKPRRHPVGDGVLAHQMHLVHGNVEAILAGVGELHEISADVVEDDVLESEVLSDAVVGVHEELARREIGDALRHAFLGGTSALTPCRMSVELVVADDRQA